MTDHQLLSLRYLLYVAKNKNVLDKQVYVRAILELDKYEVSKLNDNQTLPEGKKEIE